MYDVRFRSCLIDKSFFSMLTMGQLLYPCTQEDDCGEISSCNFCYFWVQNLELNFHDMVVGSCIVFAFNDV